MPLNFIDQRKRQRLLIIISVAVLLITGVIIWYGYFRQPAINPYESESNGAQIVEANNLQNFAIDFSVFENDILKKLEPFLQPPAYEGKLGRDNPFKKVSF